MISCQTTCLGCDAVTTNRIQICPTSIPSWKVWRCTSFFQKEGVVTSDAFDWGNSDPVHSFSQPQHIKTFSISRCHVSTPLSELRPYIMSPREIVVQSPWLKVGCVLGEGMWIGVSLQFAPHHGLIMSPGPLYDSSTSTLHFVDIIDKKVGRRFTLTPTTHSAIFDVRFQVFHLNTQNMQLSVDNYDESITSIALRRNATGVGHL